jgi:hypothetical protein
MHSVEFMLMGPEPWYRSLITTKGRHVQTRNLRAASLYRGGPSRSWLKTKNIVESEFILLGTERDSDGIPWALLAREHDGELEFAGPAILRTPTHARAEWAQLHY